MNKIINPIIIGKIGISYGVLGWNNLISYTEKKEDIFNYIPWYMYEKKTWINITVQHKKFHNNKIIIKINHINNRDQAKKITNNFISIDEMQLPKLHHSEYYWKDIINCDVFTTKKKYIGKVTKIIRSKTNDVLNINSIASHKKEILIPFIDKIFIKKIDILNKKIYINKYEHIIN